MPVIIKGKMLSHKEPRVCISIIDREADDIVNKARRLIDEGAELIEWRIDHFVGLKDNEAIRDVLNRLRPMMKETILIATIRSKAQGGEAFFEDEESITDALREIAKAHVADIIDIEFFAFPNAVEIIKDLQQRGAIVLASHHDFSSTPRIPVMKMTLDRMAEADADIVKLAVMPTKPSDVLDLLKVTDEFLTAHPNLPIITISMGSMGVLSRISGEVFGSCVTFGAVGEQSAPGQMQMDELKRAISFIHKYSC